MWEFERRGYLKLGAQTPEVVLEHPEMVTSMHKEFVHAGSDVVEAFTVSQNIFKYIFLFLFKPKFLLCEIRKIPHTHKWS